MNIPNGFYSVILDLPFNSYRNEGKSYLIGDNSEGNIDVSKDIMTAIRQLESIITSQQTLYDNIEIYYNNVLRQKNGPTFQDFLKSYSSLGDIQKVANISSSRKNSAKKILAPNLSKYLQKFELSNWEAVDAALQWHFDKNKTANDVQESIKNAEDKMTESIKNKHEQIKNILSALETLKRENKDLYTELQEKWRGKNEVIFGKERDEKGNLKELQKISHLTQEVQKEISRLEKAGEKIYRNDSKTAVFTASGLKTVKSQIKKIVDNWYDDSDYKNLELTSEEQNTIKKRAFDYVLLQLSGRSSYQGITEEKLKEPIVSKKGQEKKTARSIIQEISFDLGSFSNQDISNSIIVSRSGDIKTRPIKTIVSSKIKIANDEAAWKKQEQQLKELHGMYKKVEGDYKKTFDQFEQQLKELTIKIEYEQDKVDDYMILGENLIGGDASKAPYAIAFSDKLYSAYGVSGQGLSNIGLEHGNLLTNIEQLSSSNNEIFDERIIFTLLNSSYASAYKNYTTAISAYIEKILNAYIYNITFNPLNFVKQLQQKHGFQGEVLYIYKIGGFNIPLFEALQQVVNNFNTLEQNKQLIQTSIVPDTSNAFQLYANARASYPDNKTEQWNYVAHQVANNTDIKIKMDLHQLTNMFIS